MAPTLDELAARVGRLERHVFGPPPEPPAPAPTSHTVVRGDTLRALAVRYSVTVAELVAWNDIPDPDLIGVGQVLRLTAPDPAPEPDPESPTPDPQPDASPIPADAVLLLDGRFDATGWSAYDNMQNRHHNGAPGSYRGDRTVLVDDPDKGKVCRFTVSPGDVPNFGGGERSEVAAHMFEARTREGDERWYEFSVKFGEGFRNPSSEWCIWMQWHPGHGSPPFVLNVLQSGKVSLFDMWQDPEIIAPTTDNGVWHDYVVHARFSNNSANGWVEVWRDGVLVVPRTNHETMASASNYLKIGLYRDRESHTQVIYHTGPRIYAA